MQRATRTAAQTSAATALPTATSPALCTCAAAATRAVRCHSWLSFVEADLFGYEILRPTLHLGVDSSDIFADDAQADELDTGQEQRRHHDRGVSRDIDAPDDRAQDEPASVGHRDERHRKPQYRPHAQRHR